MGYLLKEALKTLCGVNQWSYAVFWKIDCQNPKVLIWEDCYYEPASYAVLPGNEDASSISAETHKLQSSIQAGDKVQRLVNKMILDMHVNVVGERLVGKVAFTGNHQWILSDNYFVEAHPTEVLKEVLEQLSAGMQTIAVIPVLPHGVVQFGSQKKIMEDIGFVDDVKTSFLLHLENIHGALPSKGKKAKELVPKIWVPTYLGKSCSRNSSTMSCDIVRCVEPETFTGTGNQGKFSNPNMSTGVLMSALRTSSGLINSSDNDFVLLPSAEINGICKDMMSSDTKPVPGKDSVLNAKRAACENFTSKHPNPSEHNNVVLSQMEDYNSVCASVSHTSVPYGQFRASKKDSGTNSCDGSIYESQRSSCIEMGENRKRVNNISADISKKLDETGKRSRKRSKPGENPRPRSKDLKMIEDRVKELRKIVPNGGKCSIEVLLEYTIKHMLFLQSVTKHPDKLKQTGESKNINNDGGLLLKDDSGGGATWAYEVGSQSTICPLIVEDLNSPRQMLVKMLCEEKGLFLEIADIIRGLRLTILKGVMETRKDKIWACFAIEANNDITRMEVFLSLFRLLDPTEQSSESQRNGMNGENMMTQQLQEAASLHDSCITESAVIHVDGQNSE